jgi:nucleoside-diphosphate-sugar epimerase
MKLLITGATGFIGRNLVTSLLQLNHTITILIRNESDTTLFPHSVQKYAYNGDVEALSHLIKQNQFDGIIHLASLFKASHCADDIKPMIDSNILLGTELLEACKQNEVKWFINTGTFWQNYYDENYDPVNLYAATKEAYEKISYYYTQTSSLIFTTIRLCDTFGPYDTRKKIFNLWEETCKADKMLDMTAGEQIIDISYIEDVVNAYITLIDQLNSSDAHLHKNKIYYVSNQERLTLKELAKVYENAANCKLNIRWAQREYREREVMIPYKHGEPVPNWRQQFSLFDAIQKTLKANNND